MGLEFGLCLTSYTRHSTPKISEQTLFPPSLRIVFATSIMLTS